MDIFFTIVPIQFMNKIQNIFRYLKEINHSLKQLFHSSYLYNLYCINFVLSVLGSKLEKNVLFYKRAKYDATWQLVTPFCKFLILLNNSTTPLFCIIFWIQSIKSCTPVFYYNFLKFKTVRKIKSRFQNMQILIPLSHSITM